MDVVDITKTLVSTDEWRQSLTGFIVRFGIMTVIFVGILIAILSTGSVKTVADNWSRYRCNPFLMPFAELFGYNASENFQYCVRSMMQDQSGELFSPIYSLLGQYSSSLGMIVNTVGGFRKMLGNFKLSTDMFANGVMAKIQSLLFQVRILFLRMQTLMGRVYGTMYSVIWMGTSAITAGTSLADNSLVNFMFEFCFAPETKVRMADGTIAEIQHIRIGDVLENGIRVTSTFEFAGDRTPMVRIDKDVLSADHQVWVDRWIPASQHPSAIPTSSIPLLICLNVEGHSFQTAAGLRVTDYEESSNPETILRAQQIATTALNGSGSGSGSASTVKDYALGFDPHADIWMADQTWKSASSLAIGDHIYGGATIVGLVREFCPVVHKHGGICISAAQLVYMDCEWKRAETLHLETSEAATLFQCITDKGTPLFLRNPDQTAPICVRDYREALIPDMEEPYMDSLAALASLTALAEK